MKQPQQSTRSEPATDRDAVRRCFEAYGADIEKWPADRRARYGTLAASDEFAALREAAADLDGFLNAATAPRVSADLKNRIAAQYAPPAPAFAADLSALFALLRPVPAGVLAGLGALGFAVGAITGDSVAMTPEYEAYAYLEAGALPDLLDEEGALWDED